MTQRRLVPRLKGYVIACVLLGIMGMATDVAAQNVVISTNQRVIATQLRAAVQLEQKALEKLGDPRAFDTVDDIVPLMNQAYVLIRAAREGMVQSKATKKFADPLLEYQITQTTKAWDMARRPVDDMYNSVPRPQYIASSTQYLNGVIVILEAVLEVLPQ